MVASSCCSPRTESSTQLILSTQFGLGNCMASWGLHDSTFPRSSFGLSPRTDVAKQLSFLEGQPTPLHWWHPRLFQCIKQTAWPRAPQAPSARASFQNGNRAAKGEASPHHHVLKECQQSCYFSPQITEHTLGGSGLGEGEIPKTISTTKGLVSTPWAEDLFYCVVSSSHLTAGPQHPHGLPYHAQIQVLLSLSSLQSSGPRHLLHPPQLVHLFS